VLNEISDLISTTQCHRMSDFKTKKHQIRFLLGLYPRPHSVSLHFSRILYLYLRGLFLKGERGREKERQGKGEDQFILPFCFTRLYSVEQVLI